MEINGYSVEINANSKKTNGKSMENQRGHHRAGRLSGAARACKPKPFSMLTQLSVNILGTAVGPPGARRGPPEARLGPAGAPAMFWHAKSCFRMQNRVLACGNHDLAYNFMLRHAKIMIWHADFVCSACRSHVLTCKINRNSMETMTTQWRTNGNQWNSNGKDENK